MGRGGGRVYFFGGVEIPIKQIQKLSSELPKMLKFLESPPKGRVRDLKLSRESSDSRANFSRDSVDSKGPLCERPLSQ